MKALVFHGPYQVRWEDWPLEPLSTGEVLVAPRAIGICGSDVHGFTGESGRRVPPMVMGHEATGDVVDVGPQVASEWLGRRVIIQPFVWCGTCDVCQSGHPNLCRNRRFYGASISGAMAERLVVPVRNLVPLPDALSFEYGTLTEPLSVALHAVNQAGELSGKSVLIAGCGPIGLLTLVAARRAGAACIVMTDVVPERLALAQELGAEAAIDPREDGWRARLGLSRGEFDAAFDAVGITATFQQVIVALRPGGIAVALGGWQTVALDLGPLVAREITVHGSFNFTPTEFVGACQLLSAEGESRLGRIVTATYPLQDGAEVLARLAAKQSGDVKAVLTSNA